MTANAATIETTEKHQDSTDVDSVLQVFARAALNVYFPAADDHGNPNLGRFLIENGRLPFIDDEIKPWQYRGWIVPYIQMCESHPAVSPRYDYVLRTLDAGKLLDEPIPQCEFTDANTKEAKAGMKMLRDMHHIAEYSTGYTRSFEAIASWLGFGLGVTTEKSELKPADQESLYRLFDVSKWLLSPADYLGDFMAESQIGKAAAFFPTPMCICTMMAQMTYSDSVSRTAKAQDPAVGTGRTLLAMSNYVLQLYGQDINWLCVLVSKINFALYAPWHLIPKSYFPEDPEPTAPAATAETLPVYTTKIEQPTLVAL